MKVIDQSVSLLSQEPGAIGMYKLMETCGRVCWKSEDKITEDSWKKFIKFLYNRGHWAVFNLGTVYLKVPVVSWTRDKLDILQNDTKYSPWVWMKKDFSGENVFITTNFRVLCQLEITDWVDKYWMNPSNNSHQLRVCVKWVCSRVIAQEVLRHKVLAPIMESTRYVNYSHESKGGNIKFIIPQYAYQLRDEIAETIDSLTGESKSWIKNETGEKLWQSLTVESRWAASRDDMWRDEEKQYMYEVGEEGIAPEVARGVLGLDLACEFYTVGFLKDFYYEPKEDSPEQAGFFKLRCAPACHRDLRPLANHLRDLMNNKGYDKIWQI